MAFNEKMVRKGAGVPLSGLLDQARVHVKLGEAHAVPLAKFGFKAHHLTKMQELLAKIGSDRAGAIDARAQSRTNTKTEREALSAAKRFKRLLISAADDMCGEDVMNADDRKALNAGRTLDRSSPLHSKYLTDVRDVVARHRAGLEERMGGERDPLDWLDQAKRDLDSAQSTQEISVQQLPEGTAEVFEAKGQLLSFIEKMNGAGKRAHDGDARTIATFNKDLILRAARERPASDPASATTDKPVDA